MDEQKQILDLMEDRRKANDVNKYKELDKLVKKKCNAAKEEWINKECTEIEMNTNIDSKLLHKKIQEVKGKKATAKTGCLKSKDGAILKEKEDILNRWSEYIEELFHDDRGPPPEISNIDEGPVILEDEVRNAFRKMKSGKAPGPDDIPSELIIALDELAIKAVTNLLNSIHDSGNIPEDMKKSIYIAIPKKPGTVECDQHMNRMRNKILPEISETQFRFMADKGTRNANLMTLMERSTEEAAIRVDHDCSE
ncbi:uncharacterized protein LOC125034660 [Penaeus chinensis]|uniref:uncharacterized protein LOC125034660 n=1 Tax=Penaeus chinensis TaxID=139456 RepID=UPI001FB85B96|nr:uncharacterized protein LOC125034660 [Penaeus chinensis]